MILTTDFDLDLATLVSTQDTSTEVKIYADRFGINFSLSCRVNRQSKITLGTDGKFSNCCSQSISRRGTIINVYEKSLQIIYSTQKMLVKKEMIGKTLEIIRHSALSSTS